MTAAPRVVAYDPVEHIGSTAVPGMPAKPVIDLMVGVADYGCFDETRSALDSA